MGYNHSMLVVSKVKPGTVVEEVARAFAPILEYRDSGENPFIEGADQYGDDCMIYDPETGEVDVCTQGEVCNEFRDIVEKLAKNLCSYVTEPGSIWLYNHDTGDIDDAKSEFFFGPSAEAIAQHKARLDITVAMDLLKRHLPESVMAQVQDLARQHALPAPSRASA